MQATMMGSPEGKAAVADLDKFDLPNDPYADPIERIKQKPDGTRVKVTEIEPWAKDHGKTGVAKLVWALRAEGTIEPTIAVALDPAKTPAARIGAALALGLCDENIKKNERMKIHQTLATMLPEDGNRIAEFEAAVGPYTAIVDGDALCYTISCASVVAKVVRDRMMARLAVRYPGYGWEHNQGYATREHRTAIRALGLTPFHRRSFLALQRTLAGEQGTLDLFGEGQPADEAAVKGSWADSVRADGAAAGG